MVKLTVPDKDLRLINDTVASRWEGLRGRRLFLTGGTGFFGCWLLESFLYANREFNLRASATVLTRNPRAFAEKCPHLASDPAIALWEGDVRDFTFPSGAFTHIIHAATEASASLNSTAPWQMLDTILLGTRRVLEFAATHGTERLLLTSSGAVYGRQPAEVSHITEDYPGGPDPLDAASAYAEGKRTAELLCLLGAQQAGFALGIARCFAFVGPHLPLDRHFAVGNFLRDALDGQPIMIHGDGTPYRSYLYAADLACWLWTILLAGAHGRAYNVGSEDAVSIAELAYAVASIPAPPVPVCIARTAVPGVPATRYVPATRRAREELGLQQQVSFTDALHRSFRWCRQLAAAATSNTTSVG